MLEEGLTCVLEEGLTCVLQEGLTCVLQEGLTCVLQEGLTCVLQEGLTCVLQEGLTCVLEEGLRLTCVLEQELRGVRLRPGPDDAHLERLSLLHLQVLLEALAAADRRARATGHLQPTPAVSLWACSAHQLSESRTASQGVDSGAARRGAQCCGCVLSGSSRTRASFVALTNVSFASCVWRRSFVVSEQKLMNKRLKLNAK